MKDVLHALTFIAAAGAIFIGVVLAEAWYWKRRGTPEKYALHDTVSNMTMGLSYKLVDGVFVALLGSAFFDLVHPYGLQYLQVDGMRSLLLAFVINYFPVYYCP